MLSTQYVASFCALTSTMFLVLCSDGDRGRGAVAEDLIETEGRGVRDLVGPV